MSVKRAELIQEGSIRVPRLLEHQDNYTDLSLGRLLDGSEMFGQLGLRSEEQFPFQTTDEQPIALWVSGLSFTNTLSGCMSELHHSCLGSPWHIEHKREEDANDDAELHRDHERGQGGDQDDAGV